MTSCRASNFGPDLRNYIRKRSWWAQGTRHLLPAAFVHRLGDDGHDRSAPTER